VKFKYQQWRKLYVREEGSFADLPLIARAIGAWLLKHCDDAGRIYVGPGKTLADVLAYRSGATRGDRRMLAAMIPLLFEEGYLVQRGDHAVVRNFVAAQRDWRDGEEPEAPAAATDPKPEASPAPKPEGDPKPGSPPDESPRSGNDRATTEQPPCNDAATKPETTTQNQASSSASTDLSSTDKSPPSPPLGGGQGQAGLPGIGGAAGADATKPKRKARGNRETATAAELAVFNFWTQVMNKRGGAVFGDERIVKVRARLEGGYTVDQLKQAIVGCSLDSFSMGENDRGTKFNDLSLICRDSTHVERFLEIAERAGKGAAAPVVSLRPPTPQPAAPAVSREAAAAALKNWKGAGHA
jgi:hypothetical protein